MLRDVVTYSAVGLIVLSMVGVLGWFIAADWKDGKREKPIYVSDIKVELVKPKWKIQLVGPKDGIPLVGPKDGVQLIGPKDGVQLIGPEERRSASNTGRSIN